MAYTEQGLAMLSGILNSDRAIEVNIQIMRAFVRLRHIIADNAELKRALDELRNQTEERFPVVFAVLDQLVSHTYSSFDPVFFMLKLNGKGLARAFVSYYCGGSFL
ncbi:MAG: hypothetical protein GY850_10500 [bacterium]|nr:hypothetical protein [bacterium]